MGLDVWSQFPGIWCISHTPASVNDQVHFYDWCGMEQLQTFTLHTQISFDQSSITVNGGDQHLQSELQPKQGMICPYISYN